MSWLDPRQWLLVLAFCAAGLVGYNVWSARLEAVGYDRAQDEFNKAAVAAQEKARVETARMQKEKDNAESKAAERLVLQARAAAQLRAERDGLRNDLATTRVHLRDAPVAAVRQYAAAAADIFEQCAGRYSDLASEADGHASDSLKLQQAWPKLQ